MRIGFIGFGEAASAIATGLRESGVDQVYAYDAYRSDALQHRVQQASAILVDSLQGLADLSELVLSLVTAKSALPVAREFATYVTHDVVYADLNSCSPKTKQQIAEVFGQGKVKFASVAVMSAVPPLRHKVPMLSDGPGADDFAAQLMPFGMNIEVVNGEIGSAAGIKMCRSVIIKGMKRCSSRLSWLQINWVSQNRCWNPRMLPLET
ncbi:NAD(P)-binding domain-containing protein [Alicyclobacillus sp. ALC3]|uniref:NAD(P)-binding domain-containing protein n=1 Tax=Alicyclobacillus sp. ALC3 TaxID=2796143 RepID=UPI002378E1CD|nr:NAD(P)-binding domain-containing protein [Alicyclobacillus sp. ALC3]WDL97664.1 NAD(P)-dependent oxidoreductase [Alicyclobacillus sp. ALC3]